MEDLYWRIRHERDKANGGADHRGEWVVIVRRDDNLYEDLYFPNEEAADQYVEQQGLEGVPIFPVR